VYNRILGKAIIIIGYLIISLLMIIANPIKVISAALTKVYSGVTVTPSPITVGQNFQVTFSIREINGESITFAEITCAVLDANDIHLFNLDVKPNVYVPANGTYTYTASGYTHSGHLSNPGTYKAMARGRVPGGNWFNWLTMGAGVNPRTFQVVAPTVSAPTLTAPANYSIFNRNTTSSITIQWTSVNGANEYWLNVFPSGQSGNPIFDQSVGNSTSRSINISGLSNGIYIFQVRARASGGNWSNYSQSREFIADTPSSAPSSSSPNSGSTFKIGDSQTFSWTAPPVPDHT